VGRLSFLLVAFASLATLARAAGADEPVAWSSAGELGLESRAFPDDHDPVTRDQALGMLGRLELRYDRAFFAGKVRGFGRLDVFDRERTTLLDEEAWLQAQGERLRLRLGVDIVNWTALEAFHPADVINARNLDSDLENFERIGEPMVALQARAFEQTTISALLMPVYMISRFPSPRSRLNLAPPGIDLRARPRLIDRSGRLTDRHLGPQAALQVRQVVGSADASLHLVESMDRLHPLVLIDAGTMSPVLLYQTVRQVGGTYQQVFGPVIAKAEGGYRWFVPPGAAATASVGPLPRRNHGIAAGGLEYRLAHRNGSESTLLLEGQTVLGVDRQTRRTLEIFQRDLFVGVRFARNDEAAREALLAAVIDLERPRELVLDARYQQRVGETWTVKAGVRIIAAKAAPPLEARGLQLLRDGDHAYLDVTRHF
jgi:hypothetical protein